MKQFFVILLATSCAVILFLGNQQWKEKIQVKSSSPVSTVNAKELDEQTAGEETEDLLVFAKNWPEDARNHFSAALEENRPYSILLAGSPALGKEGTGWADLLESELAQTYGEAITVTKKSYEMTSLQFTEEQLDEELATEQADMVLLEPFVLMNNGKVGNDAAEKHYSIMIDAIKKANPNAVVILQPANPLSRAKFYPVQVDRLKEYAESNEIPYLDHWQAWPETEDERAELLEVGDPSFPNEEGHRLWANYLIEYFVAKQ